MVEGFGKGVNGFFVVLIDVFNISENKIDVINKIFKKLIELDNVFSVIFLVLSESGDYVIVNIVFKIGFNDEEMINLVYDIRDIIVLDSKNSLYIYVMGMIVINIDIVEKLNDVILLFVGLIVGFVFLLLVIVF